MSTDLTKHERMECSALVRIGRKEYCGNGFPVSAACVGIDGAAAPVCCNERIAGRMYPDTGKPEMCPL